MIAKRVPESDHAGTTLRKRPAAQSTSRPIMIDGDDDDDDIMIIERPRDPPRRNEEHDSEDEGEVSKLLSGMDL